MSQHGPALQQLAPLGEPRQALAPEAVVGLHLLADCGQPAPSFQFLGASTGPPQEAAGHLVSPGSDLDDTMQGVHAAHQATGSLNGRACAGTVPWVMPEAEQTMGCWPMPEQGNSDPQQQHVVTSDQPGGSLSTLGSHKPPHPASQTSEIYASKPPSQMGQLAMAGIFANEQDRAAPLQACLAVQNASQDAGASVAAPAALSEAKQSHAADHHLPHHQHNGIRQALKAHQPAKVGTSYLHASRLRAYSQTGGQAWRPEDDRLLYVDGSEASDLLLAPFQLDRPAGAVSKQSYRPTSIPHTASAAGSQKGASIPDRHHATSAHQSPREQLLGQDGLVAAEPGSAGLMPALPPRAAPYQQGATMTAAMTVASVHAMLSSIQLPSHQHQLTKAQQVPDNSPLHPVPAASNGTAGIAPASADEDMGLGSIPTLMSYAEAVRVLSDDWPIHQPRTRDALVDICKPPEMGTSQQPFSNRTAASCPHAAEARSHSHALGPQGNLHNQPVRQEVYRSLNEEMSSPFEVLDTPAGLLSCPVPTAASPYRYSQHHALEQIGRAAEPEGDDSPVHGRTSSLRGPSSLAAATGRSQDDECKHGGMGLQWLRAAAEVMAQQRMAMRVIEAKSCVSRHQTERQLAYQQVDGHLFYWGSNDRATVCAGACSKTWCRAPHGTSLWLCSHQE